MSHTVIKKSEGKDCLTRQFCGLGMLHEPGEDKKDCRGRRHVDKVPEAKPEQYKGKGVKQTRKMLYKKASDTPDRTIPQIKEAP
jgi:hypothetical protein